MAARDLPRRLSAGLALIVIPFVVLIGLLAYEAVGRAPRISQSRAEVEEPRHDVAAAPLLGSEAILVVEDEGDGGKVREALDGP